VLLLLLLRHADRDHDRLPALRALRAHNVEHAALDGLESFATR
jgi:hypothetical protein